MYKEFDIYDSVVVKQTTVPIVYAFKIIIGLCAIKATVRARSDVLSRPNELVKTAKAIDGRIYLGN